MEIKRNEEVMISVIVPVYNVYEWIDQCLESIVNQTFKNFEVILINDGSTDGSDVKCQQWMRKDNRINFISKENEGLAITRNLGLQKAKGKYIVFIDSDDWLDLRFFELMFNKIEEENADLVECDFWRFNNNSGKKTLRTCYGNMGVEYSLEEHMVYGVSTTWKYMTKKSLWIDNHVKMPNCISASHGIYALLLALSNKVVNIHEPLYYYRRFRKGSILDTIGEENDKNEILGLQALEYLISEFQRCGIYKKYASILEKVVIYSFSNYLASQFGRLNNEKYGSLCDTYYKYLELSFLKNDSLKYLIIGGYNLNRILSHVKWIQDPYCRFNFSSIVSIISKENSFVACSHNNRYREIMINRDINNMLWSIIAKIKPKYIFLDFLEERFDLVEYEGQYITKSDAFNEAEINISNYRIIKRSSQECERLWKQQIVEFINKIQEFVSLKNIIIIKNYLSEFVGNCDKKIQFANIEDIKKMNSILERYYDFVSQRYSDIKMIDVKDHPLYFTDIEYEHGAIPSHLNEVVNESIAHKIEELIYGISKI